MALIPNSVPIPLQELYVPDPRYDFTSLRYPDNLDHISQNGHYINFYVNVNKVSKYYSDPTYSYTPAPGAGGGSYFRIDGASNGGNVIGNGSLRVSLGQKVNQRINQAISLYMPDSLGFSHTIQYGTTSVAEFGRSLMKAIGNEKNAAQTRSTASGVVQGAYQRAVQTVGAVAGKVNDILNSEWYKMGKDIGGILGGAINPQLLVLFRGVSFRNFQFDFTFTPRNESEAASVRNIIKAFRFHAYPEIATDLGVFYIAPSTFDIEFIHKNKRNTNISMIKTCVLTGYAVDYAPYGFAAHTDGMPVQTTLSLTFQETEIITKAQVEAGF